jgi:epoxyqueuosine reductase QueG
MGNSGDRGFIPRLEELARYDDPVIREHAQWALAQILTPEGEAKHE